MFCLKPKSFLVIIKNIILGAIGLFIEIMPKANYRKRLLFRRYKPKLTRVSTLKRQ